MKKVLLCYVAQNGETWEAICLDYDLAVQGNSFKEVQADLTQAIRDYVAYTLALPVAEQAHFFRRRVPLWTQLVFVLRVAKSALFRSDDGDDQQRIAFTMPCAA